MTHMDPDLYDAVMKDNVDVLEEDRGRVRNQLTPTNSTVLHLACQYGSINCVKQLLVAHQSLLFKINSRSETALHLAARQGHFEVAKLLVDLAKSPLLQPDNYVPNTSTVVQNFIRTPNVDFETALHMAVRFNRKNVVELLVKEDRYHSHPQNKHNETPLYLASIRYYTGIIAIILRNCETPTFGGPDGRTALHAAVLDDGGHECVKLLLAKNKELIKVADNYGWTAYHYVAYNDFYAVVEDLVRANRSVAYLADKKYKRTALHVAAYKGNLEVLKKLVEYFPDSWESVDGSGRNILHIAVEQDRKNVIKFILSQGYKACSSLLVQRDKEGNTPLHLIAKLGCYVPDLMDPKALGWEVDWEVLDDKNLTPLDVLHSGHNADTLADQALVRRKLINSKVKKHWHLWRTLKEPDIETGIRVIRHNEKKNQEQVEEYKKAINTHMIVAALIATVALTAGFAMPGGFDGNPGPTQGSAILLKKTAFQTFIVTDTIALLFSISSLFLYFMTTLYKDARRVGNLVVVSALLNVVSIIAMMLAFLTGTYAILAHSSALAISVCVIASLFFLLVFLVFGTILCGPRKQLSNTE